MIGQTSGVTDGGDLSGLRITLMPGVDTYDQIHLAEAHNMTVAYQKYFVRKTISRRTAPFDLYWTKKLHHEMFGRVWDWAGQFRTSNLNIGVPCYRVASDLSTLLDDLSFWEKNETYAAFERAVRLHHRSVLIHPFYNGNGRWARAMTNIYLKQQNHPMIIWPDTVEKQSPIRGEYLATLKTADNGDLGPFLALHRRYYGGDDKSKKPH
jgi:Fic-DOC domain mobile mystery protein B